ncbi:MAG TPA: hypothetical protein VFV58_10320 [Blastocatellia bacterium]|jgi:hypothetical protein|nr:hypothetical protein [Blastocatellia bacterium]
MRHKLTPVLLLVVFSLGFGLTPVGAEAGPFNLTGTWNLQYMGGQGPIKMTFVFKQNGEKLTGDYSGPFGPRKVTGAVKGNKVVFGWEMSGNMQGPGGPTFVVAFKGAIESATKMTGTVGNPFCGDVGCEWTGMKKK